MRLVSSLVGSVEKGGQDKREARILRKIGKLEKKLARCKLEGSSSRSDRRASRPRSPSNSPRNCTSYTGGRPSRKEEKQSVASGQETGEPWSRSRSLATTRDERPFRRRRRHLRHPDTFLHFIGDRDGIRGCRYHLLAGEEPRSPTRCHSSTFMGGSSHKDKEDLSKASEEGGEVLGGLESEDAEASPRSFYPESWSEARRNGLTPDRRRFLLEKYSSLELSEGGRPNPLYEPPAKEGADDRRSLLGVALAALARAMVHLNKRLELGEDEGILAILETLDEAADVLLDARRRQERRISSIDKRVKRIVKEWKEDRSIYENDHVEEIKSSKTLEKVWSEGTGSSLDADA